jgi:hypothetical protein
MNLGSMPRAVRWTLYALGLWTLAYAVHGWMPSHPLDGSLLGKYASDIAQGLAGVVCGARVLRARGHERAA